MSTKVMAFRADSQLAQKLESEARRELRPVSRQIELYVREGLARRGLLPPVDGHPEPKRAA